MIATDAVKRAMNEGSAVTVSVVPIVEPLPYEVEAKYTEDPLKIGYIRVLTYR